MVQYKNCWCSNYVPGDSSSTGDCSVACPGYPYENCGDQSKGLYGYVALGPSPSGTRGASSPSPSPSQQQVSNTPQPVSTQLLLLTSVIVTTHTASTAPLGPLVPSTSTSLQPSGAASPVTTIDKVLTILPQTSSQSPKPVTVQDTVTATPSVLVSVVSVVCLPSFLVFSILIQAFCLSIGADHRL